MKFKKYIPSPLSNYYRLQKLRRKFNRSYINSYMIDNNVSIGDNCKVHRQTEVLNGAIIGDYSYINAGTIIASGKIGKFTSIGYYCQIGVHEHPINYISSSPYTYGNPNIFNVNPFWEDIKKPPIIGNDVWIGSHATILQGVTIGDGSIIAAGAVVNKDVAPYSIVGGIPARLIRMRFEDEQIQFLLNLKWWNLSREELQEYKSLFLQKEDWMRGIKRD